MIIKENLLKVIKKESSTTLKAMRAFPEDYLFFTPHERSSNARNVMRTFVFEMYLVRSYALGEKMDRSVFQTYAPEKLQTLIADFEKETNYIISSLEKMPHADFSKSVEFAGKKTTADEFILGMIFNQIHHRGQLSV